MQLLTGIRLLDLSHVLAGLYCTMVLSDLGADVIKAESPEGDETRGWGLPFTESESAYHLGVNRNKRSIIMDFKTEPVRLMIHELIKRSDVLVEAREMLVPMKHPEIENLRLVGSPLKFGDTPVDYRLPPPKLGEHTEEILKELFG